ncbi:hypothetical protein QVD17_34288 [Tagetes erecta]|uniref:TNase-like domain-containing protein n=1 Tax=Tagetes erecta TaxID=13708 RepID=A0AAD8JZB7_TARER|nr:hypothetical protein QVD17_34288 [Tagetes erecta]
MAMKIFKPVISRLAKEPAPYVPTAAAAAATMGNALRFLCCSEPQTTDDGVSSLAHHLHNFEITSQLPDGLSAYVISSKKAQIKWYRKLAKAWRESQPPPTTPQQASSLIVQTLRNHKTPDVQGLLRFYGLPVPYSLDELTAAEEAPTIEDDPKYELHTLRVDGKTVPDGDGLKVYVDTANARESSLVPHDVLMAAVERNQARAQRNFTHAKALQKQIIDAGYQILKIKNVEILARKYRIRLRGIDAPELGMPYGKEAKDELVKIVDGKCLKISVFDEDHYHRCVGDVYCDGVFVQKKLLKKGLAWHFTAYDKRPQLAKWEKKARAKRIGLWALSDPEKPWEWRRKHPQRGRG